MQQGAAHAQAPCPANHDKLLSALKSNVKASGGPPNGGFETNEWAAVVARDGAVCAVAFSGPTPDAQWPGSRLIAAEKANTANGLSLANMALSTANLYAGAQPGGSLFGLQATNPVNQAAAYAGDPRTFGSANDPLIGKPIGGVVVFGGGLALYDGKAIVGGLGISGDSSCADHNVAWRVRAALGLDKVPAGVNPNRKDAIIYDLDPGGKSASGWGHPLCAGHEADIAAELGSGVEGVVPK
ncbi:heme-binding protein [Mesorhizobium sp. B2-7-1]|uniref:heme-binding protein n=1 Tax=Mesorhizobium sp. B2-7-1 TaxID=2589909 RepID=UPI00112D550C|nr:heme-binding protein [Mesorhizobium sp. B2-7-1]TPJ74698.1 heme-binding protein [Mesorhizobium sp. B2-7-1]